MIAAGSTAYYCDTLSTIAARRQSTEQAAEKRCRSSEECARESLRADIRAADASEGALDLSVAQIGFNLVGLMGLGLTLYYAHRAWEEARVSARAATASIDHLAMIERAYVYGTIVPGPTPQGAQTVDLKFVLSNLGNTPARLQEFWLGAFPVIGNLIAMPTTPDYSLALRFVCDTVFSAGEKNATLYTIAGLPMTGIAYAQFKYLDVFGKMRVSRFAVHYDAINKTADTVGGDDWNYCD